jgi:hypothetical protein
MKLITLNVWGGKIHEPLVNFLSKHREDTDIFLFQEVYDSNITTITPAGYKSDLLDEFKGILFDFDYFYSPAFSGRDFDKEVDYNLSQGLAAFWKKDLRLKDKGAIFTHNKFNEIGFFDYAEKTDPPRLFQYLEFEDLLVINFHGYWEPRPKFDTPQRLEQSKKILDFISNYDKSKIVAGDFNLNINTQSVSMLESKLTNHVKEEDYKTTRSAVYDPEYKPFDKFADYIFSSRDIKVNDFEVMKDVVSDHLPLMLDFQA